MKKRIFTMLLCGLLILGTTACDTENPTTGTEATTENTTVTTTVPNGDNDPEPPAPPAEPIAFASYKDILDAYFMLNKPDSDEVFMDTYSKLDDREKSILSGLRNLTVNAGLGRHGYSICDLNEDGVKELVFLQDGRGKPRLLFTEKDGLPVYIDDFHFEDNGRGAINKNGVIYKYGYGKGESTYFKIYRIVNGEAAGVEYASYYATPEDFEAERLSYGETTFQGEASTTKPITKSFFDAAYVQRAEDVFKNPEGVTYDSNIGAFYTLAEFDDYYMLLREGNTYYYELYDESENLVKSETSDDFVSLYREEGCDIVQITSSGYYTFYDVKNNLRNPRITLWCMISLMRRCSVRKSTCLSWTTAYLIP